MYSKSKLCSITDPMVVIPSPTGITNYNYESHYRYDIENTNTRRLLNTADINWYVLLQLSFDFFFFCIKFSTQSRFIVKL